MSYAFDESRSRMKCCFVTITTINYKLHGRNDYVPLEGRPPHPDKDDIVQTYFRSKFLNDYPFIYCAG